MRRQPRTKKRRGVIAVLTAIMLVVMLAMVAFAVDVGYLVLARSELQRSADAAALGCYLGVDRRERDCSGREYRHDRGQRAVNRRAIRRAQPGTEALGHGAGREHYRGFSQ